MKGEATLAELTQRFDAPGTVPLQAKVRNTVGIASITIVDDSARALYTAPVVTVTQRFVAGYVAPAHPPWAGDLYLLTVSASAMAGASITSVVLYVQHPDGTEFSYGVPLDGEFIYATANVYLAGVLVPESVNAPAPPYRVVVTDSHGLVTVVPGPHP